MNNVPFFSQQIQRNFYHDGTQFQQTITQFKWENVNKKRINKHFWTRTFLLFVYSALESTELMSARITVNTPSGHFTIENATVSGI